MIDYIIYFMEWVIHWIGFESNYVIHPRADCLGSKRLIEELSKNFQNEDWWKCAFTITIYLYVFVFSFKRIKTELFWEMPGISRPRVEKHTKTDSLEQDGMWWLEVFHFLRLLMTEGKSLRKHFIIHDYECK